MFESSQRQPIQFRWNQMARYQVREHACTIYTKHPRNVRSFRTSTPTSQLHSLLNSRPNTLDDLAIPPPSRTINTTALLVPAFDSEALHTAAPAFHFPRNILASPADVDASRVLEQLRRGRPFIRFELPGLARGEDSHETVPVVRAEVGRAVDEDEAGGFSGAVLGWSGCGR